MARLIRVTGLFLTLVFGVGARLGATMTMSASVAHRTTESAHFARWDLHAPTFCRPFCSSRFCWASRGGLLGVAGAALLNSVTISTVNWGTGAELAFAFHLTPAMVGEGLLFAAGMGVIGGLVPAARAARIEIVHALGQRTV